jgi:hypothetical protein
MKTLYMILGLSFFSTMVMAQTAVSSVGNKKDGSGAALASYVATGKVVAPDTPKRSQGKTFGEKVSGGLVAGTTGNSTTTQKSENPLNQGEGTAQTNPMHQTDAKKASPGNPIGGIIVKGARKEN